jgi:quercetin dioxygenase-like cupin family protein
VGLCQRRGETIEIIHPGDRVFFEPGEDHWPGAAPDRLMTHKLCLGWAAPCGSAASVP